MCLGQTVYRKRVHKRMCDGTPRGTAAVACSPQVEKSRLVPTERVSVTFVLPPVVWWTYGVTTVVATRNARAGYRFNPRSDGRSAHPKHTPENVTC